MPLDSGKFELCKNEINRSGERRIYVCESGDVRIEEKHFRATLAPGEFVALLQKLTPSKICRVEKLQSDLPILTKIVQRKPTEKAEDGV